MRAFASPPLPPQDLPFDVVHAGNRPPVSDLPSASPRVIVVDDHDDFRFLLRTSLEGRGCVIVGEAADGQIAVELAATVECDRMVMDYRMPVMDGVDATRLIAERRPAIEIIAFTDSRETAAVDGSAPFRRDSAG